MLNRSRALILSALAVLQFCPSLLAQTTAFTYQGRLNDGASPAHGSYDLRFALFDDANTGSQQGDTLTNALAVSNGLFVAVLDFGNQFTGADRWLEIAVRTNGGAGFATLAPRQRVTPTPYAIQAASANAVGAENITGTIGLAQLPANVVTDGASGVNLTGTFSGSGAGLTGINLLYANSHGAFTLTTNYDGGNFVLVGSPSVGNGPESVAAADVNGDGRVDLITANALDNSLSVLTNNGNGSFALSATLSVGATPVSVTTADVNADGNVDVISANNSANSLSVLTNNGTGDFVLASAPGVSGPQMVRAADVNGDGKIDLACVNVFVNTLSVLTNSGAGNFVISSTPATGNSPRGLLTVDVNNDGKVDLINGGLSVSALSVLTNNGVGSFSLASSPGVGNGPFSIAAADVNSDGKVDLISANILAETVSVLTNNGNGTFTLGVPPSLITSPRSVTTADVNGDGKPDLIIANQFADSLSIFTNNGAGVLTRVASPAVGDAPQVTVAADVNGDGAMDLVSVNSAADSLSVLLNTPFFNSATLSGTFQGNGAGVSNVNALTLNGLSSAGLWKVAGNSGTTPGANFVGTTDNQPLEFKVNNQRGLRLEHAADGLYESINTIGGSGGNFVSGGAVGATIAGGGAVIAGNVNRVLSNFGTVSGGESNTAANAFATVAGGRFNVSSGQDATVSGGQGNAASAQGASSGGGFLNTASGNYSTVSGGRQNVTAGGAATVAGGRGNAANWEYSTVSGGSNNVINGDYGTIPGGRDNAASLYAFAAGRRAKANHAGSFVWADLDDQDFASTTFNQFLIRANGGVGINTNNPNGAMLAVNGNATVSGNINASGRINAGTLGIGTSNPQGSLHVYSLNNPTVARIQSSGTPGFGRVEFVSNPQGDINEWRPGYIQSTDNGGFTGGLAFFVNGTGAGNKFGSTEVMRVVNGAVGIGTNAPVSTLHVVGTVTATAFNPASDRNLKENFAPVNSREVLEKVAALPISRWNFKGDDATPHVGPMAQDFHAAFSLGTDERHIATVDADGIALAAIQGLNQKLEETRSELKRRNAENADLKARLEKLEQLLTRTANESEK